MYDISASLTDLMTWSNWCSIQSDLSSVLNYCCPRSRPLLKLVQILQINFYPFTIQTLRWNHLCGFEINLLSLCIHNPHTVLLISWYSFGGKTGIFASCVIYCGTHLHIKALISSSERERGNSVIIGRVVAGDESVFGSGGRPRGERGSLWVLVLTMRRVLVGFVFFYFLSSLPEGGWGGCAAQFSSFFQTLWSVTHDLSPCHFNGFTLPRQCSQRCDQQFHRK